VSKLPEVKRILIVDDEPLARQRLTRYVRQYDPALLLAEAESGLQAVELIRDFQPDVVLLDVEMPGLTGFEVLQQCPARNFCVIFQTAYDQFAIRAFEEHALDYLLKPFTAERLQQALERAFSRLADETRLQALEAQLAERLGYLRRFTVKQGTRLRLIEEADIFCFISQDHYTCVFFRDRESQYEGIIDLSLTQLLERIDPAAFRQLHRNNIVRVAAISALVRTRAGELQAELSNGQRLPVSRRQQAAVRALIKP
jgi:two-component system, LytTR family, response regulator